MLRIISAALNDQLFFKIAGHQLTVVEVDATYVKPFNIDTILVSPGQTTNVLVTANKPPGKFLIIASPFMDSVVPVDDVATSGLINYSGSLATSQISLTAPPPQNKTDLFTKFATSLKSLNSQTYPCLVPSTVDHSLLFTVGVGLDACANCDNGVRFVADINNITFEMPTTALLQAHYFNKTHGVFSDDFPGNPLIVFNYTGTPPNNTETMKGTRLYRLAYNSTVQIVLQGTQYVAPETHPMHLHGFNFFEVGRGFGDYESKQDPLKFNLVDPVERNTIGVPTGGWTAIRFRADNPGVWFFHCHLEVHTTWGLKMAFVVDNGNGPNESVLPPPSDLPTC
ncbi:hypothetical protein Scep_015063 [Stephania cephalantha]|uniref:Laccase n=1 Tax=Stephania cephalantha TaxID=152367 RepID=A0AAP0P019_9MAGN